MNNDLAAKFRTDLLAAAKLAGFDVTDLRWESVTTDTTWGDRCGYVFTGCDAAVNERAAKYFQAWIARNAGAGSYGVQRSIGWAGEMLFTKWSNGVENWHRVTNLRDTDRNPAVGDTLAGLGDARFTCLEVRRGFAVSTTYYPCAE